MITEDQLVAYYEKLAKSHHLIAHQVDGKKAFFEINEVFDLNNFDEALRTATGTTVMLITASESQLDDNNSESHNEELECEIYLLQRKKTGVSEKDIRTACKQILKEVLGRTKRDSRSQSIVPGERINFRISQIPVQKVGPMKLEWYGYQAVLRFTCPFGYTVDSGTWTDI